MPAADITGGPVVFDSRLARAHRDRAAPRFAAHDFLFREIGERLTERLEDVKREFPAALDLGCHAGGLAETLGARGGVRHLVQCDSSIAMARRAGRLALAAEADFLPFATGAFDLVLSNLALHWINDLPGALLQIRQSLRPDGLFLAAILGGDTLWELREALMTAELEEEGGASARISPFASLADAGALLQRAGFALPVADADRIQVTYPDALALMRDLRAMGETNAARLRRDGFTRRGTILRAAQIYGERFADDDGRIPATFQVFYLTGWAPHESQPRPRPRGSAKARLADALDSMEASTGEAAPGAQPDGAQPNRKPR